MALTTRDRFTTTIDKEVNKELKQLSKDTMIPISKLIDKAVGLLLKDMKKK
ncbi:ribbon-helix-helix domain-containing protein [Priestia filamentosa]|uniref:ribbon-helix-helix domain-containing protein n=1 Tax=Priestia filamentosa TaxID=1402861 RepID=UPI0009ED24AB|nr:ribbon-helix-helix domain-containing protein [Priestia filamentosa]